VTNQVYGGVFKVTKWLALTGTYQESSLFTDNFGTDLFGKPLKPRSGHGEDYGVRFTIGDQLHASFTYFDNMNENVPLPALSAAVSNEIRALVGAVLVGNVDSKDEASRGIEFETTTNFTRSWTSTLNFSRWLVHPGNTYPQLKSLIEQGRQIAQSRGQNPDAATATATDLVRQADADAGAAGMVRNSITRWAGSFVSRYSFTEGVLKGFALGGSVRYASGKPRAPAVVDNVQVLPDTITKPQLTVSPFAIYRRKIGRLTWTGQVNVNNIFNRITDQGAQYRYPRYTEPRQFIYTLTTQF
jgi:outer membrane receptor for ferric coprogen and ferric-rhodotorulic acid